MGIFPDINREKEGRRAVYKIMIVEDDAELANQMKKHIEAWGNEVFCARDFANIIGAYCRKRRTRKLWARLRFF
mgnify:CR=1 FL=1